MFCTYSLPSNRRTCRKIQEQSNLLFAHFSGIFPHDFANVYDLVMFIYSSRFSELSSLTYKWEVLMGIQVEKFENSHIHGSRSFRVFIRAILANVLQLFATLDIYYSQHFRNFAVLHTNESSSSVDIHLAKNNSRTFGISLCSVQCFRWLIRISVFMLNSRTFLENVINIKSLWTIFTEFAGFPTTKVSKN
jgi:hypothetical protein